MEVIKIPNKENFNKNPLNDLSDIELKDFMKLRKGYAKEQISFLENNATLQLYHQVIH